MRYLQARSDRVTPHAATTRDFDTTRRARGGSRHVIHFSCIDMQNKGSNRTHCRILGCLPLSEEILSVEGYSKAASKLLSNPDGQRVRHCLLMGDSIVALWPGGRGRGCIYDKRNSQEFAPSSGKREKVIRKDSQILSDPLICRRVREFAKTIHKS